MEAYSHLSAAIPYWPVFVVACCTKLVARALLHGVARRRWSSSAMQAESWQTTHELPVFGPVSHSEAGLRSSQATR